jgi:hypothetical protein
VEPVRRQGDELHPWWIGRQWAVTAFGIEARDGTYAIGADRLLEDLPDYSLLDHMGGKEWVDLEDFVTAFLVACALHEKPVPAEVIRDHYRQALVIREEALRMSARIAVRIPIHAGHLFRDEAGHHSDLIPATVPR